MNEPRGAISIQIKTPPYTPPSPAEIRRRKALYDAVMELRERSQPLGVDSAELIREDRDLDA